MIIEDVCRVNLSEPVLHTTLATFMPLKLEPFEMPPTYVAQGGSSHKKLVITVADSKHALKNASKKSKKKSRKENLEDCEPITVDSDSPPDSEMMKRAIERSKLDMGILKRRDTLAAPDEPVRKVNIS